jgi:hypothetical protein
VTAPGPLPQGAPQGGASAAQGCRMRNASPPNPRQAPIGSQESCEAEWIPALSPRSSRPPPTPR